MKSNKKIRTKKRVLICRDTGAVNMILLNLLNFKFSVVKIPSRKNTQKNTMSSCEGNFPKNQCFFILIFLLDQTRLGLADSVHVRTRQQISSTVLTFVSGAFCRIDAPSKMLTQLTESTDTSENELNTQTQIVVNPTKKSV